MYDETMMNLEKLKAFERSLEKFEDTVMTRTTKFSNALYGFSKVKDWDETTSELLDEGLRTSVEISDSLKMIDELREDLSNLISKAEDRYY